MSIDFNMFKTYSELASSLISRLDTYTNQYWIGIAGPPGAGKTTLSAAVSQQINSLTGADTSIVLPMDGYHYSRAELKQMEADTDKYTYESLLARRGAPWTFDSKSLVRDLLVAKSTCRGSFPLYDRKISDPVPNALELLPSHRIVLVEGNYLLAFDDLAWAPLREVFDEKWFVTCARTEDVLERLVRRHLLTWTEEKTRMWGEGEAGARAKAEANDMLNAQYIVEGSMKYADRVIHSV